MKRLAIILISVAVPVMAFAQAPDTPTSDAPPDAAGADGAAAKSDDAAPPQSPAEQLFAEKCASCHSIGKGDRVGPDLKGVHERRAQPWLEKMIGSPNQMLDSDSDARELLKKYKNIRMPDLGLKAEEVSMLIELMKRCSVETCNLAGVFVAVTEATADDVELGRKLFIGEVALAAGGPPCLSCHTARGMQVSIAGGTLAKDLTHVFARLGDEGLDGAIKNPAFILMKDIYADKKIDKDEAFALRAFLSESNRATSDGDSISVFLVSAVGTVLCFFILNLFWRRRLRGVRKPLVHSRGARSQGVAS